MLLVGHSPSPQVVADHPSECIVCVASNFAWFQPHCRALKRSHLQFKSILHFKTISVNVTNIDFNTSRWSAFGVNISFTNCDIKFLNLKIIGGTIPRNSMLHIIETQVGCMFLYDTKATMKSCTWNHIAMSKRNGVCIYVSNSTIIMKSSLVANFKGASFIQVTLGRVNITNANFVHCVPEKVLINVRNQSRVSIENNTFSANHGQLLFLYNGSIGLVENSLFEQNKCEQPLTQVALSFIEVTICHFLSNTVETCLHIQNRSIAVVRNSKFVNNTASYAGGISTLQSTLEIYRCLFCNNTSGGVKVANSFNTTISNCMFHKNSAAYGGGLFVILTSDQILNSSSIENLIQIKPQSNNNLTAIGRDSLGQKINTAILIHNCTFIENNAHTGGAIFLKYESPLLTTPPDKNSSSRNESISGKQRNAIAEIPDSNHDKMWILDSFFGENKAVDAGGAIFVGSQAHLSDCAFVDNTAGSAGGAINSKSITMTKCQFQENSAHDGGALFSEGLQVHISKTNFTHNRVSEQGGALSLVYNKHFFCSFCSFCNNTAGLR